MNCSNTHYFLMTLFLQKACGLPDVGFSAMGRNVPDESSPELKELLRVFCTTGFSTNRRLFLWLSLHKHGSGCTARGRLRKAACRLASTSSHAPGTGAWSSPQQAQLAGRGVWRWGLLQREPLPRKGREEGKLGKGPGEGCGAEELAGWLHVAGTWHTGGESLPKLNVQGRKQHIYGYRRFKIRRR